MDRFQPSESERCAAMRTGRLGAVELLLCADFRERAEPVAPPVAGRVLHALAVLRQPSDGGVAATRCGVRGQWQAYPALDGRSRTGGDLPRGTSASRPPATRSTPICCATWSSAP